jgi:opacity protein-like surface antigen
MGSFKALTFASVVALASIQTAKAADLLPPPPPIEAPLRGPVIEESGFYMRADAGLSNTNMSGLRSTFGDGSTFATLGATEGNSSIGDPGILDLGFGYQINSWLRADLTGEYRSAVNYTSNNSYAWGTTGTNNTLCTTGSGISCGDSYAATLKTGLVLANGYLDMGTWYGFTPYVGAGVGTAIYQVTGLKDTGTIPTASSGTLTSFGYGANHSGMNFAFAGMAGVSYHIMPNLLLDVGYRYVDMGTINTGVISCNNLNGCHYETQHFRLTSNDIRVGLRWMMAQQAYYDPGVRAKY